MPDAVLSRRLRDRDHAAWEELYAAYGGRLRAFALRLTRDPHEADDLVQETFVRALPRLDRMDADEVDLRAYLFTTLRNTFYKSCERGRRVAPVEDVPEPDTPGAIEDDPERSLLLRRQIEEVRAATAMLAPRQRLALALRELEDCSYAEIGTIVGIKENAVAQLISRARESLRSSLRLAQVDPEELPDECRTFLPQLSRHIDGQLRGEQQERTLDHLLTCERCQDTLASMREASRRYRSFVPPLLPTEDAHAAAIDAQLTAAGYWEPRRRPRVSRHGGLVAAGVLVLVGLGALVLAAASEAPDRPATPRSAVAPAAVAAVATATPAPTRRSSPTRPASAPATSEAEVKPSAPARARAKKRPATRRPAAVAPARKPRRRTRASEGGRSTAGGSPAADPAPDADPGGDPGGSPDPEPVADTSPPTVQITSISTPGDTATFGFTSERDATFACALDDGAFAPCRSEKRYGGLAAGAHSFAVRATDEAGNTSAPATHAWQVAEPRPDLVITSLTERGFTVANTGTVPAGSFVLTVTLVGSFTFAGLGAGEEATRTWTCRRGTLDAIADRSDTVAESDEANNRRSLGSSC